MPYYESVFIIRQDIPATQVETLANTFVDIVRANGGKVTKTEQWGLRTLAYKIKKNKKGHYVLFNLDASPAAVAEMERNMGHHEDILRVMTVKVEELESGPSAMMRREDRDGERSGKPMERGGERPLRAPRRESTSEEGAME